LGCAFCGKTTAEVDGRLVRAGTTGLAICEECARLCVEIFEE
jgi:ATP-dependent protease Clp ATPase subunit